MADEQATTNAAPPVVAPEQDALSVSDHKTYAQQLYGKPSWVVAGAISFAGLRADAKHEASVVKKAIEDMLGQKDKRYGAS